jgi:hypothetical protein
VSEPEIEQAKAFIAEFRARDTREGLEPAGQITTYYQSCKQVLVGGVWTKEAIDEMQDTLKSLHSRTVIVYLMNIEKVYKQDTEMYQYARSKAHKAIN